MVQLHCIAIQPYMITQHCSGLLLHGISSRASGLMCWEICTAEVTLVCVHVFLIAVGESFKVIFMYLCLQPHRCSCRWGYQVCITHSHTRTHTPHKTWFTSSNRAVFKSFLMRIRKVHSYHKTLSDIRYSLLEHTVNFKGTVH